MDFRTDTVESGGVRTDFAVFGHGTAHLVIIPGMSLHSVIDSAGSVASAFSCLADDYTVWLLERRRDVPDGLSVAEMASDAAAAMESLGIGRADIYGASQGGMIALELALRHPGLVRRLVLASTITRQCARSIEVMGRWEALSLAGDPEKLIPIDAATAAKLPPELVARLEGALPAVSLVSMSGILTAFANDVAWETAFAQQVYGLGNPGDVLIALSTSGNSANCVNAALVAKAKGMKVVSMTGAGGGKLGDLADAAIRVPETETYKIQELHLPVYHALCAAGEDEMI